MIPFYSYYFPYGFDFPDINTGTFNMTAIEHARKRNQRGKSQKRKRR